MKTKEFLEFSKKNREEFLNLLSSAKEINMEFICRNEVTFYLQRIFNNYKTYLQKLFDEYIKSNNLTISFNECVCDFIDCLEPQINNFSFITKDEYTNHVCCVEYNMIINIHKFSYELFILNNDLNELDFFHGDSLTSLLEENKITIEQFRKESYYDIDNFNHIDLTKDLEYVINSTMMDIYLLTILSDVIVIEEYKDFFNIIYHLNSKKFISRPLYRYLLTMEDVINMKISHAKGYLYAFFSVIIILTVLIFIAMQII